MIPGADILLAVSTLICGFAIAGSLAAWVDKRFPVVALAVLAVAAGVFVYAYAQIPDPNGWREVPDAFISVAARLLN